MKLAGFHLRVVKNLTEKSRTEPPPIPPSVNISNVTESPDSNGSVSTSSLALYKPESSSGGTQRFLDKAADEGLVIISSPRVRIQILCALHCLLHDL